MLQYLSALGVRPDVVEFFAPFCRQDAFGSLLFSYGDAEERFGASFHRVPVSEKFWMARETNLEMIRTVIICSSAMEAIAWLHFNHSKFQSLDSMLFLSPGLRPQPCHFHWIHRHLPCKEYVIVYGKDLPGRVCTLKLAAGIRGLPLSVALSAGGLSVDFRHQRFTLPPETDSLSALEKCSGYRFRIRCPEPHGFQSYLHQLQESKYS